MAQEAPHFETLGARRTRRLGFGERKRAEQQGVDDGEDDDVGADAESEDEDGDGGKAGVAAKGAEGVAEVLKKDVKPGETAGFALMLLCLLDAAEADEGATTSLFGDMPWLIFCSMARSSDSGIRQEVRVALLPWKKERMRLNASRRLPLEVSFD